LTVDRGLVFGLLGPNGAGKTTLIRSLLGFLKPTSGEAKIDGSNCLTESVVVRSKTAYLPAEAKLFRAMKGRSALEFFAEMHPMGSVQRSLQMASRLDLDLSRRVAFMSTGMRQKLAIASVLSCRAPLIILDEPTANLDPSVRSEVLAIVRECKQKEGQSIMFSSHVLSEIEEICDAAAIMRAGEVVHTVTLSELRLMHRLDGKLPTSLSSRLIDAMPDSITLIEHREDRFVVDLRGTLESHLGWIQKLDASQISIQPIALRSVYDQYHRAPDPSDVLASNPNS
jgi:ABC-2 type transport system ATP-binding protein